MNAANFKTNRGRKLGKYLLIAAVIGAIVVLVLLSAGIVSWEYLIKMHFKLIEACPFCM